MANHLDKADKGHLKQRLGYAAFAFRGYDIANLGRTPELLQHPAYGAIVELHLRQAGEVCAEVIRRPVDLVSRIREGRETRGLIDYAEDVALIVGVEVAHMKLLEEFHGISLHQARQAMGYSLGESAALMAAGVYEMRDLLRVPLALANDCAALADDVTLGVFFSRGPVLDLDTVQRMCLEITQQGKGTIGVSTYLSPNSLLLLGQKEALGRFETLMHKIFPERVYLRRNPHRWPPLHTPITWQRAIPNRAAVLLQTIPGGFTAPSLPIVSMVTGEASYDEVNSREMLHRWVDHPQRLWDVVYTMLANGIDTVVHVGPAPNLLPATFDRLKINIQTQLNGKGWGKFGRRAISHMARRPWLTRLLPSFTALFRAPFVKQINLEDWLLEQKV
ncbi:MAG: ACP S-malonyltransferase [Planctomycetes bacterium]|nr:ACP S-malonyltransferase [Planctomycetota bacterium]